MMVSDVLRLMSIPLNDNEQVTYTVDDRIDSLNAALRSLASVRPDSTSDLVVMTLVPGALQTFPPGCEQFLDVCYRMDPDVFDFPLRLVSRKDLDANDEHWCQCVGEVEELATDDRFPRNFWVRPVPDNDSQKVMLGIACPAPVIVSVDEVWPVLQKFIQPCIEYALYWLFSRDSTVVGNANRAAGHLNAFSTLLGLDTQTSAALSPVTPDYKQA